MTKTEKQTMEAIYRMYMDLPLEIRMELKKRIDEALESKGTVSEPRKVIDFDQLEFAEGWDDTGKTYSRDELYEDDRV
ncbi:MAG: hypothetical protein MUD08_05780 [Cytophagales bacterium]|jgi:hypothetical protein|nr:hypothetical protein [Cytophagales bacterium]